MRNLCGSWNSLMRLAWSTLHIIYHPIASPVNADGIIVPDIPHLCMLCTCNSDVSSTHSGRVSHGFHRDRTACRLSSKGAPPKTDAVLYALPEAESQGQSSNSIWRAVLVHMSMKSATEPIHAQHAALAADLVTASSSWSTAATTTSCSSPTKFDSFGEKTRRSRSNYVLPLRGVTTTLTPTEILAPEARAAVVW